MLSVIKVIWYIICAPGYAILWFNYFFPTEWGKKETLQGQADPFGTNM